MDTVVKVVFGWGKDKRVAGSNNTGVPLAVVVDSGLGCKLAVGELLECKGLSSKSEISERLSDKWDTSDSELGEDGSGDAWADNQSGSWVTGIELTSCSEAG
jgi:hypothetical protein